MKAIVAVDQNWGIGYKGNLLAHIPADMRRFRAITMGHPVLYGRKTLDTFPHKEPLPGRVNYVLSRNPALAVPGAVVLHSTFEADKICPDDTFVIGGAEVYDQMLLCCSEVYVTKIATAFPADAWFHDLDRSPFWELTEEGEMEEHNGLPYQFMTYKRKGINET